MVKFEAVTIIICVVNETVSLQHTVTDIVTSCDRADIGEILIVYPQNVTRDCLQMIYRLEAASADIPIKPVQQQSQGLDGALKEAFEMASCSHILGLPADNAIALTCVPVLIRTAKSAPDIIISTSRWLAKGSFSEYSAVKLAFNRLGQSFLRVLFGGKLTDYTNPVQIAPAQLYKAIRWENFGFGILLEMTLKPLRLGYAFSEIPVQCTQRSDGKPKKPVVKTVLNYLKVALRVRFLKKSDILK